MIFSETKLAGAYTIDIEQHDDHRGYFARVFCVEEFVKRGLKPLIAQANISGNAKRGTLRGLHFQYPPAAETKYVRCIRGAVLDVIVDLRPESPTFLEHLLVELSAENGRGLYVPERFAHGFITLRDETELLYLAGGIYSPGSEGALRYDDPLLEISLPVPISVISERDRHSKLLVQIGPDLTQRMRVREPAYA